VRRDLSLSLSLSLSLCVCVCVCVCVSGCWKSGSECHTEVAVAVEAPAPATVSEVSTVTQSNARGPKKEWVLKSWKQQREPESEREREREREINKKSDKKKRATKKKDVAPTRRCRRSAARTFGNMKPDSGSWPVGYIPASQTCTQRRRPSMRTSTSITKSQR
jgi:hypothetical protein